MILLRLKQFEKTNSRRSHQTSEWKTKNRGMVSQEPDLLNQSAEMYASVGSGLVAQEGARSASLPLSILSILINPLPVLTVLDLLTIPKITLKNRAGVVVIVVIG